MPRPRTREMTALSRAQLWHFLQVTTGAAWHALWTLLGTTGLGLGEVLGLTWRDIDLETGKLLIQRSLQRQPGGGLVFVPPKTEKSRRTVHLSELTLPAAGPGLAAGPGSLRRGHRRHGAGQPVSSLRENAADRSQGAPCLSAVHGVSFRRTIPQS